MTSFGKSDTAESESIKKTWCRHPEWSLLSKNVLQNKVILVQIWAVLNKMSVLIGLPVKGTVWRNEFLWKDLIFLLSLKVVLEGWFNTATSLAGWRRMIRQVWFCTWWTSRIACLFRTVPVALTGAAQLRADGISSCCYIVNVHNHPSWALSWAGTLLDPCLLSGWNAGQREVPARLSPAWSHNVM